MQEQRILRLCRQYFEDLAHFVASNVQNCLFQLGKYFLSVLKTDSLFCATCALGSPHVFNFHTGNTCNKTNVVDE